MTFAFIDLVFGVIILALAIAGTLKGFVAELFGKAAFILGLIVAVLFYGKLHPYVARWVSVDFFAQAIAFILLFVVTFLLVKIVQHIIGSFFQSEIMSGLNRALGFFLGVIEGLLVVAVILIALNAQPWFDISGLLEGSFFSKIMSGLIAQPVQYVNERIVA